MSSIPTRLIQVDDYFKTNFKSRYLNELMTIQKSKSRTPIKNKNYSNNNTDSDEVSNSGNTNSSKTSHGWSDIVNPNNLLEPKIIEKIELNIPTLSNYEDDENIVEQKNLKIESDQNQVAFTEIPLHESSIKTHLEVISQKSQNSSLASSMNLNLVANDSINLYKSHEKDSKTRSSKPVSFISKIKTTSDYSIKSKSENLEKRLVKNLVNSMRNFRIQNSDQETATRRSPLDKVKKIKYEFIEALRNYNLGPNDELKCSVCCVNNLKFSESFFAQNPSEKSIILTKSKSSLDLNQLACKINSFNPFIYEKCKHLELDLDNAKSIQTVVASKSQIDISVGNILNKSNGSLNKFKYNILESTKSNANDLYKKLNSKKIQNQIQNLKSLSELTDNLDLSVNSSSTISIMEDSQRTDLISGIKINYFMFQKEY